MSLVPMHMSQSGRVHHNDCMEYQTPSLLWCVYWNKVPFCSTEGEFEVAFDKADLVHMDDAMTVPVTGGFYKTVAHHFYEVSPAVVLFF